MSIVSLLPGTTKGSDDILMALYRRWREVEKSANAGKYDEKQMCDICDHLTDIAMLIAETPAEGPTGMLVKLDMLSRDVDPDPELPHDGMSEIHLMRGVLADARRLFGPIA